MASDQHGWRPVLGWEGRYEVSSHGAVRKAGTHEVLGQWKNSDGYLQVRMSNPRSVQRVHRLVAGAFCLKRAGGDVVNHIDNNPANNDAGNLEWCSQRENLAHSRRQGRMPSYWTGKRTPATILTDEQVRLIRRLYVPRAMSAAMLAKKFAISKRSIQRVISKEAFADVV